MPGTAPHPAASIQTARVSSSDLPTRGFSDALEAVMGRDVMGFDLRTPGGDSLDTFRFDGRYSILGSGAAYSHLAHTPLHYQRTPALMSDGLDELTRGQRCGVFPVDNCREGIRLTVTFAKNLTTTNTDRAAFSIGTSGTHTLFKVTCRCGTHTIHQATLLLGLRLLYRAGLLNRLRSGLGCGRCAVLG